jgi:hypothetical protein
MDKVDMGNALSTLSMLTSSMALQNTSLPAGMAVLKKSNDMAKQEGEALIQLLEQSLPQPNQCALDIYA